MFDEMFNNGVYVEGNATTGDPSSSVSISDAVFTNNGSDNGGLGDIDLFTYNGNASFANLTLSNNGARNARLGIQLRGVGSGSGVGVLPMGAVTFNGVTITGKYKTQFIGFQRYSDVSTLGFTNVALGGATSEITGGFGALLRFDAVGSGSLASPATVNLGNTYFRGVANSSAVKNDLEFAPDNTFTYLLANATGTRWDVGLATNVAASALTISQAYAVEDRILHYSDPLNSGQAPKGFAEIQNGKAFVTPTGPSSIQRAIDAMDASGTLYLQAGSYTGNVDTGSKAITLSPGASAGQVTIGGNLTLHSGDTLVIEVNGTSAATNYDNFVVTGSTTLGNATLNITVGYSPSAGDTITIIDSTTLGGTFGNYAQGAVVSSGFRINYNGGNANVELIENSPPDANAGGPYVINEFDGVNFNGTLTTDPDTTLGDTLSYAWDLDNDGFFDDATGASPAFTWAQLAPFGITGAGVYTIKLQVTDALGAVDVDTTTLTVLNNSLRIIAFNNNPSGFSVQFNRAPTLDEVNLYDSLLDGSGVVLDAADITLVGNSVGNVLGSIVWNATTNTMTFIKTGGILSPDTYTVTVRSGSDAFHDAFGKLDGDGDLDDTELPDNYTHGFVVGTPASGTKVVSVHDFARGPRQHIDDDPAVTLSRLAVSIDDASGVTSLDFHFEYDANFLTIHGASLVAGLPGFWSITVNNTTPGLLIVSASGTSPLSGSNIPVVLIDTTVKATAPYGESELLKLTSVDVNENPSLTVGDWAIHKNIFIGDTDGDGGYTGFDAALVQRNVVLLDNGFDAHDWTDPRIVGDVTGNGSLSGQDASFIAQKAVGISQPKIPNIPPGSLTTGASGVDPQYSIPANVPVGSGTNINLPVNLDVLFSETVYSATFEVTYETNVLAYISATRGSFWTEANGWNFFANEITPGVVRITLFNSNPSAVGTGDISILNFNVLNTAPNGVTSPVTVGPVVAGEGGLTWTNVNGSVVVDSVGPSLPVTTFHYDDAVPLPQSLQLQFAENVSGPLTMTLTNVTTSQVISVVLNYSSLTHLATYTFLTPGGILPDGNYQAVVLSGNVTDQYGHAMVSNLTYDFFFLKGDANHDRVVNIEDMRIYAANFGQSGKTFSQGDFNYDGTVDRLDLSILAQTWQYTLLPPPPPPAPVVTSTTSAARRPATRAVTSIVDRNTTVG